MTNILQRLFSLEGKTALITGATGGIGSALAKAFAEAGATVGVHGRDVAKAIVLLAQNAPAGGEVYNVATGRESTISEVAELLLQALGLNISPEFDGDRPPGDPANWRADIARLRTFGFEPEIALEDGLAEVAQWCVATRLTR